MIIIRVPTWGKHQKPRRIDTDDEPGLLNKIARWNGASVADVTRWLENGQTVHTSMAEWRKA